MMSKLRVQQWLGAVVLTVSPFSLYAAELGESIKLVAQKLAAQMQEKEAKKIAVVSFTDLNGYESALSA